MKPTKTYKARVAEILDNGDAIIEFSPEMCKELGWNVGDTVDVSEEGGKIYIKNLTKGNNDVSST